MFHGIWPTLRLSLSLLTNNMTVSSNMAEENFDFEGNNNDYNLHLFAVAS